MLAVAKIFEDTLSIGAVVSVDNFDEAYNLAEDWIHGEYEARGINSALDTKLIREIQRLLRETNYYNIIGGEEGKSVSVQIIEIE